MDIKLFSDLIDSVDKIGGWLKSAVDLPKNERDKYRDVLDDTYSVIDAGFLLVITRLSDILDPAHSDRFDYEVRNLGNKKEWLETEKKIRLCASLRKTRKDMDTLKGDLAGAISTSDWKKLKEEIDFLLNIGEGEIAGHLSNQLVWLAQNPTRSNVEAVMESSKEDRRKLIQKQIETYKYF